MRLKIVGLLLYRPVQVCYCSSAPDDAGRRDPRDGRREDRDDRRDDRGRDGRRRRPEAQDARRTDFKLVQRLPDGAVIPASGRRGRRRPDDCQARPGRSGGAASPVCEDTRGRSPPSSPRTTSCDVVQLSSSSGEASWRRWIAPCFGSSPRPVAVCPISPMQASASPRSTMLDVIEIVPASSPAAHEDDVAATPPCAPSVCSEPAPVTPVSEPEPDTPVHVPAPESLNFLEEKGICPGSISSETKPHKCTYYSTRGQIDISTPAKSEKGK